MVIILQLAPPPVSDILWQPFCGVPTILCHKFKCTHRLKKVGDFWPMEHPEKDSTKMMSALFHGTYDSWLMMWVILPLFSPTFPSAFLSFRTAVLIAVDPSESVYKKDKSYSNCIGCLFAAGPNSSCWLLRPRAWTAWIPQTFESIFSHVC